MLNGILDPFVPGIESGVRSKSPLGCENSREELYKIQEKSPTLVGSTKEKSHETLGGELDTPTGLRDSAKSRVRIPQQVPLDCSSNEDDWSCHK